MCCKGQIRPSWLPKSTEKRPTIGKVSNLQMPGCAFLFVTKKPTKEARAKSALLFLTKNPTISFLDNLEQNGHDHKYDHKETNKISLAFPTMMKR